MSSDEDLMESSSFEDEEDLTLKKLPEANYVVHEFKKKTFKHPVWCAHCNEFIWGVYKQGYYCKNCTLSVHKKCRLAMPAPCTKKK
eukprot:TRINITY_DN1535_c0_g1_i1.p1 TRINITY_DN1535_c0_g1~~TRINITY_DN1535_c0_g1_i1.p1  ORF type:complete len:100 (-),score=17.06 TRINITY_DN1535_c0_g1_i1:70-327(-)